MIVLNNYIGSDMYNRNEDFLLQNKAPAQSKTTLDPLVTLLLSEPYRWRLFIDGRNQDENDPYIFDKKSNSKSSPIGEKGYFDSMNLAFDYMLKTIDEPLSLSLIETYHDLSIDKVVFSGGLSAEERKGYRKTGVMFRFNNYITIEGIEDFITNYNHFADIKDSETNTILTDLTPKEIYDLIQNNEYRYIRVDAFQYPNKMMLNIGVKLKLTMLIEEYEQHMQLAMNDIDKLNAIVRFAHAADILHPFIDANIRTFVFLIVNKLLLQNGFFPAIFANPNFFDCLSVRELNHILRFGQMEWLLVAIKEKNDMLLSSLLTCKSYLPESHDFLAAIFTRIVTEAIKRQHLSGVALILKSMQDRFTLAQRMNVLTPLLSDLFVSASSDMTKHINLFIEYGVDMNQVLVDGHTLLTWAIEHKNMDLLNILITAKVDFDMCDQSGKSPLQYATDTKDADILHIVIKAMQPYKPTAQPPFFAIATDSNTVQDHETQKFKKRKQ